MPTPNNLHDTRSREQIHDCIDDFSDASPLPARVEHQSGRQRTARPSRIRAGLLLLDFLNALVLLSLLRQGGGHPVLSHASWPADIGLLGATLISILLLGATGAYDPASRFPGARLRMCGLLLLLGCGTAILASFLAGGFSNTLDAECLALVAILLPVGWISGRVLASIVERRDPEPALILGTGATAQRAWELSKRHRECAFRIVGFVDDDPLDLSNEAPPILGGLRDLPELVRTHGVERIIVAYSNVIDSDLISLIRAVDPAVRIQVIPRLYELVQAPGLELGGISVLEAGGLQRGKGERCIKRLFDVLVASIALVLLAPVMIVIALCIKAESRGPVFFRQERIGRRGAVFQVYKFRTMAHEAEDRAHELVQTLDFDDAVRELKHENVRLYATCVGRYLRHASLDELPQLLNVVQGQMSLVGPRPLRDYEVDALSRFQAATRQSVRPGITGLWQVSGRSAISWEERVHLDCVYARHWSVTSDLRILARTVGAVLKGKDAV